MGMEHSLNQTQWEIFVLRAIKNDEQAQIRQQITSSHFASLLISNRARIKDVILNLPLAGVRERITTKL